MPPLHDPEWDLPRLRASFGFEYDVSKVLSDCSLFPYQEFFDVKFYPYDPVGSDPIFAAVSKKHVVICRLVQAADNVNPCEVIRVIRDDDQEALNCSCCWSKEAETDRALLCVAGRDAKIKVYNVRDGKLHTTLVGHGGEINDLATSPDNPRIIASASDDTTVRLWSLEPVHARQPCVCLLGGEGHSWSLLSAAFHNTGRYLLSAGHDQVINLWTIPELPEEHVDTPLVVHYPHFSTSEVHYGLIDCVAFYGDLILSRACHEEKIVLWRIEGFDSEDPPPPPSTAPTAHDQTRMTRSAFAPANASSQWQRLLQFETKNCGVQFFLRFSLHHVDRQHPILCFCNARNEIMWWDMMRLTAYQDFINSLCVPGVGPDARSAKPSWLLPAHHKSKGLGPPLDEEGEKTVSAAIMRPVPRKDRFDVEDVLRNEGFNMQTIKLWQSRFDTSNPNKLIKPHRQELLQGPPFVGRQVAWSLDGCWCVVVGSRNHAVIFQRWAK
ncbi:WD40 repeat-like protein, partial [Cryphonectria parasitica EP155]